MNSDRELRLNELQEWHDRLVQNPKFSILGSGPRGQPDVSKEFVVQLGDLTPTQRRLVVAKACVAAWADSPDEVPECYTRELEQASYEATEEHRRCSVPSSDVEHVFASDPAPISRHLLSQLAELTPTGRRASLAFVFSGCWRAPLPENVRQDLLDQRGIDWGDGEQHPEWIRREYLFAREQNAEERVWWSSRIAPGSER